MNLSAPTPTAITRATVVRQAVAAAGTLTIDAAATARQERAQAGRAADHLVAHQAAQDAAATRYRVDAAATRVRRAAEVAAEVAWRGEADPASRAALLRASRVASIVRAAAAAVAEEAVIVAGHVEDAVTTTAEDLAATRRSLHRAIEDEVAATASALHRQVLATADLVAVEEARRPA